MKKLIREPLLHFLLIGAALFGISWMMNNRKTEEVTPDGSIIITDTTIEKIKSNYQQHSGITPSQADLNDLIKQYIRNEVLYKEALKAGLDKNNDSIKMLLAEQMNTAYELAFDSNKVPEPTDEQLVQYLREHRDEFAIDLPIEDTLSAVQTSLHTMLRFKFLQAEKKKRFEDKMSAIEAQYQIVREDSFQTKAK